MSHLQEIFTQYRGVPVTSQCYKELGQKIRQSSQLELDDVFESFQPEEFHLQLMKLTIARASGCHSPLLNGLKDDCRYVSEFCLKSKLLFNGAPLLNPNFLLPLLQTVSLTTRNRVLWNLGKYISTAGNPEVTVADVDTLFYAVKQVWGSRIAQPLLCQTSKELIEQELPNVTCMPKCHLLVIAERFPYLALSLIEQNSFEKPPHEAARYIVRKTIPKSFAYLLKQNLTFLSKSTMKIILQSHTDVILESPSSWVNVLDMKMVKKVLKPEHFELFVRKQLLELKDLYVPYNLISYLKLLPPVEVSSIFNKVFQNKFGCSLRLKLEFWETNSDVLKLLETSDRSFIVEELDVKNVLSNDWVPLMTTDKSIPRIKKILYTEQDAHGRASLISQLVETAVLNDDQSALNDICSFVVTRYRNDKVALLKFFKLDIIDFSSLSTETWDLAFALARKFYNPDDWQTHSAAKLFAAAIKRDGLSGLKAYLEYFMKSSNFSTSDLEDLQKELHSPCIDEVFTTDNIENKITLKHLANFLPLISKWSKTSSMPLINENVTKSVLTLLKIERGYHKSTALKFVSENLNALDLQFIENVKTCVLAMLEIDWDKATAVSFVCENLNAFDQQFIEDCFQKITHPMWTSYLLRKNSSIITTNEASKRIGEYILKVGVSSFLKLLIKLKKLGYVEVLQHLSTQSKAVITDTNVINCQNAVILLMLTTGPGEFFSVVDPLLPNSDNTNNQTETSGAVGDNNPGRFCSLNSSSHQESIYYGIGLSFPHYIGLPSSVIERLLRFCHSADLVLFVRDSLYSVSSFLPNETAHTLLLLLMQRPVSIKKHALRMLQVVCNIKTREDVLQKEMESEKHLTMRIVLMDAARTCLNESKSVSSWHVLREMMNKLTPDDKTIVQNILYERVPEPFLEEYYHVLLEKSKTLNDVDIESLVQSILQLVSQHVSLMSYKFVESLVVEYFLSERFFGNVHCHSAISYLLVEYLQGKPASKSCIAQSSKQNDSISNVGPQRNIKERQHFLKERLDTAAISSALDIYNADQSCYPVRRLLMTFIEIFCTSCLRGHLEKKDMFDMTEYISTLLSYFDQNNQSVIFWPFVFVSLTKILTTNTLENPFVMGQKIGEYCDSVALQSSVALYCHNFPLAVASFIDNCVESVSFFTSSQFLDILGGILAAIPRSFATDSMDGSQQDLPHMLRLMTVAHILPQQSEVNKGFRQTFLVLIKNTPVEVFLFNAK